MLYVPSSLTLNQRDADHMIYSLPHVYHCYCQNIILMKFFTLEILRLVSLNYEIGFPVVSQTSDELFTHRLFISDLTSPIQSREVP